MKHVQAVVVSLATLVVAPAVGSAAPDEHAAVAEPETRRQADDDAARYSERETSADEQLAFRGSQGAQYTSAAQLVGVTLLAALVVVVVIVVVAL